MKNIIQNQLFLLLLTSMFFLLSIQISHGQLCNNEPDLYVFQQNFDQLLPDAIEFTDNLDTLLFSDPNNPDRGLFIQANSGINPAFQGNSLYARDLAGGDSSAPYLDPFKFVFVTESTICECSSISCSGFDFAANLDGDTIFINYRAYFHPSGTSQSIWDTMITDNGTGPIMGYIDPEIYYEPNMAIEISGSIDGADNWLELDNLSFVIDWGLPVTYEHFTAKALGNEVLLDWKTSEELNNQGFDIERSYDGINFTSIGHVYADEINTEGRDYQFLDKNPGAQLLYYRLNQIDADGTHTYSDIISVVMEAGNELKLDAQQGQLRFLHAQQDQKIAFSIYNLSGKLIQQGQVIGENYVQTTPQTGIYLIHYNQNGAMQQSKVLLR